MSNWAGRRQKSQNSITSCNNCLITYPWVDIANKTPAALFTNNPKYNLKIKDKKESKWLGNFERKIEHLFYWIKAN